MKHDNELIQIFREEARDILDQINICFKKWSSSPADKEALAPILRDVHTLKGSSRMVGLISINEYIQILEKILQEINREDGAPAGDVVKEIQSAFDYLNYYVDAYKDFDFPDDSNIPMEKLKKAIQRKKTNTPSQEEKKDLEHNKIVKQENIDYYIRIKSEQLEKLSKLASQIGIIRSHAEHNLKALFQSLNDAVKQIKVSQEQLKYLQMKADANIRSYTECVSGNIHEEFDILELDRYSFFQQSTRDLFEKSSKIESIVERSVNFARNFEMNLVEQKRLTRFLEEEIIYSRLISVEKLIPRLERVVRQVSNELSKDVHLEYVKVEGKIDRKVVEQLIPAFEHMIRNAIDHGIETPEIRREKNKPAYGRITLSFFKQGNEIVIQLEDDGQGIDVDKIKKKAIEKKLWEANVPMSHADAFHLIFLSGFSTKDSVTPISGRGVGLDVVNTEVNKLGGVLKVDSQIGIGTQFTIRLPFSLSLNQALIFTLYDQFYALPLSRLVALRRYSVSEIKEIFESDKLIKLNNNEYTLFFLGELLEKKKWKCSENSEKTVHVMFLKSETNQTAILVDKLIGSWEIAVKPVGSQLQSVREISGVYLFGEEKIVLILDVPMLIHQAWKNQKIAGQFKEDRHQATILVVDDSVTVRQVTSRLLVRHQFKAVGARDGKEALFYMRENIPDVVLLDLEMPEMDGFEVLEKMRNDPRFSEIPVIVITSRSGEKHQARAFKLGVSGYLAKPYLEEHLVELLRRILYE